MALYPKIQSPCPYKGDLSAIMDGANCRLCKRQVFDLSDMSDGERVAFMAGCKGEEVCVSYRVRPMLAAAALAVAAIAAPTAAAACDATDEVVVTMGGIKDTNHVQFVQYDPADRTVPNLPVVYEVAPNAGTTPASSDQAPAVNSPAAP